MDLKNISWIDLTHDVHTNIPHWDGRCGFSHNNIKEYSDCSTEVKFCVQKFEMFAGIGTHMDAPAHCFANGKTIEQIPLEQLIAPCVVIDVSTKADQTYRVSPDDILAYEKKCGEIAASSFVAIHTGWDRFWQEPTKYRNNLTFPSIAQETAELLLTRNIVGLGIDTLSPDIPAHGFGVHKVLLGAGKYIIENMANTKQLPPTGAYILALPIKVAHATEAPMRLIALQSRT